METTKKISRLSSLIYLVLVLFSTTAFARLQSEDFVKLQNEIQKDVESVVKKFDPESHVIVRIKSAKLKDPLPTTPFAFQNLDLKTDKGNIKLKKVYIKIYSKANALPDSLRRIIKETSKKYGASAKISLKPLPTSINTFIKKFLDRYLLTLAASLLGLTVVFMLIMIATRRKGSNKIQEILDQGMGKIASSLENSGHNSASASSDSSSSNSFSAGISGATESQQDPIFEELDSKGFAALLSDCYWGEFDSYAAFIWSHVPLKRRKEIIRQYKFLEHYASYFANIPKENLNMHEDPYYLKPHPIHKIDNKDLSSICTQTPGFYASLSVMRKEGLVLTSREQIKLLSEPPQDILNLTKKLASTPASTERKFAPKVTFKINSMDEEKDVLSMTHLTNSFKAQIPTLGWAMELSDEKISDIFLPHSAENLASAWIAPDDVLNKFKSCIPEKKYQLITSYLERATPTRTSSTFISLHKSIVNSLKDESSTDENSDTVLKAA